MKPQQDQSSSTRSETTAIKKEPASTGMFVHSELDELGLSAAEFRVYGHLVRRANGGVAWPSVESMSRYCRLHPQTIRRCIQSLKSRNMLHVEPRAGETSNYILTQKSSWHRDIASAPSAVDAPASKSQATPHKAGDTHPYASDVVKGIPSEVHPEKEIHVLTLASNTYEDLASAKLLSDDDRAAAIYDAYPRRMGRPRAIPAIQRALRNFDFEKLLALTQKFAALWAGAPPAEMRFCPYPAKWFGEERYADDPQNWRPPSVAPVPVALQMSTLEKLIKESPRPRA